MTLLPDLAPTLQRALGPQYRIERELGRGGMGVVYLARDLTLDRLVAVKVIHPDLSANRTVVSRFLTEARAIAKLRHPNIVAVHAAGEIDGQLFFVMDYLAGETLRDRLRREGPLSVPMAVRIASDIALALDQAAAAGIVHRDLKPENILLEGRPDQPTALLADFGIARLSEPAPGATTGPGAVMGTPAYMSPEQAAGEDLDRRSDLYSLGIVTYEMLTGRTPFEGSHRTVISKQILDAPRPLLSCRDDVPASVANAVMRALEKVPEARWPTGDSLRSALLGEVASPSSVPGPQKRRRSPALIAAIVVAAATALGVALTTLRSHGPPSGVDPRRSILVLPFENLRQDPGFDWLREGSVSMLTLALSQWQDLTVVDQARVHDLISKEPTGAPIGLRQAMALARASRAWTVVLGDFSRIGDSLHLVARRYDVGSGQRLDVIQVDGLATAEDVRPLYDELAAKLLDLTGAPQSGRASLASVTTKSVEAYRAYLQGVDALNHWRLSEASQALESAVRIDPQFSLANFKLAVTRGWISSIDTLGLSAIRRASRTAERLPPRDRQLIDSYLAFLENDFDRSLLLYAQLIARDSTDVEAWYGWADASFHGGYARSEPLLLTRSLRGFRQVIELDSTFALAYEHAGALLTDAAQRSGWLRLVDRDSLVFSKSSDPDSLGRRAAQHTAQSEAVALARAWTQIQPSTPRAHYHLYKAYLTGGRVNEARQTVGALRALYPDSSQPFFGFLDARAQFVGGDIEGSARTVKDVISKVDPAIFEQLDFAPEPIQEMMTGVDALGYLGDVEEAASVIKLGRAMFEARAEGRDPTEKARADDLWELSRLGVLYGAAGTRPDRLRSLLQRSVSLVQRGTEKERHAAHEVIGGAAIGLLLGPAADVSAVAEIDRLTSRRSPASVRALIAARAGDTTAATALLAQAKAPPDSAALATEWPYPFDRRPILAETYFELGKYRETVETLTDFGPEAFLTRGLDSRWILLPRVRLLRGQALEHLGRSQEAAIEFRAVVDQWSGGDVDLLPVVQEAQRGLARVAGIAQVQ